MGASILWTPGKCVLSAGKTHVHEIPRLGGGNLGFFGGGECRFYFMGARIFLIFTKSLLTVATEKRHRKTAKRHMELFRLEIQIDLHLQS